MGGRNAARSTYDRRYDSGEQPTDAILYIRSNPISCFGGSFRTKHGETALEGSGGALLARELSLLPENSLSYCIGELLKLCIFLNFSRRPWVIRTSIQRP